MEGPYVLLNADIGLSLKRGLLGTLLDVGAAIGAIPEQLHHHAFLIFYSFVPGPGNEKGWWVIEAAPPAVDTRLLTEEDLAKSDFYRVVGLTDEQRKAATLWALEHKGERYDYWDIARWAWETVANWFRKVVGLPVKAQRAYKCSDLVVSALREGAGVDICPGKPAERIWPTSDIADSPLTVKVELPRLRDGGTCPA